MTSYIWKPSTVYSWKKKPVLLVPDSTEGTPTITVNGKTYTGQYINTNEGRKQYGFDPELVGMSGLQVSYGGQTGNIESGSTSYEGSGLSNWTARAKGTLGSGGGYPSSFAPGTSPGGYGAYPAYMGDMFPSPILAQAAQLMFTDPAEFAQKYSPLITKQFLQNYDVAHTLALKELNTELEGMEAFVPAAAALKRKETSVDNIFNQYQRTQQLEAVAPGINQAVQTQLGQAQTYMSGRAPDEITDRAMELGVRSSAADLASQGGFGASSSVAKKTSDLMSADQRIKLSQYGNQLLGQNLQNQNFLLAPTEYSNAGQQVNVMPSVSGSQLASQNLGQLNQYSMLPISSALSATIQQNTTQAGFQQAANMYNAGIQNQFAMDKFNYMVNYAGALAGANQTDINTGLALQQQQQYYDTMKNYMGMSQNAGMFGGLSQLLGAIFGSSKGGSIIDFIKNNIVGSDTTTDTGEPVFGNNPSYTPDLGIIPAEPIGVDTPIEGNLVPNEDVMSYDDLFSNSGLTLYNGNKTPRPAPNTSDTSNLRQGPSATTKASVVNSARQVLRSSGISDKPQQGYVSLGVGIDGKETFAPRELALSTDTNVGAQTVNAYSTILDDLGAFNNTEDKDTFDSIASISSDASALATLSDYVARGDKQGFVTTILGYFKKPLINNLTDNTQDRAGINAAMSAGLLFTNWDRLSPAQKSFALANVGIKGYQYATGEDLASKYLISPSEGSSGMTLGQGLGLLQTGYNTFSLVKNWDDLNTLQKIAGVTGNAASVANLAKSFGMLGEGASGASVAVNATTLADAGFSAVPQFGVGAVYSPLGSAAAPEGYTLLSQGTNGTLAVPTSNAASAEGALAGAEGTTISSALTTAAGVTSIALGAHQVYKGWGQGGSKGAVNGTLGGSAIAAGMYTLGATNPYALAAVVAVSILGDTIKTGKSTAQMERDAVRSAFKSNGLIDDKYNLKLADGSTFDIGIDGHSGYHYATDSSKMAANGKGHLNAWDVDYTNDLDYAASMGGIALSRLLTGAKATNIDQIGGQISNAALGNIGYNKEMTQDNYNKMMANMRGFYSQSGIKSKAAAYQLANQAFAEGRISAADLASMQHTFNMMYDKNSYGYAKQLMEGRWDGIQAVEKGATTGNKDTKVNTSSVVRPLKEEKASSIKGEFSKAIDKSGGFLGKGTVQPTKVSSNDFGSFLGSSKEQKIKQNKLKYNNAFIQDQGVFGGGV